MRLFLGVVLLTTLVLRTTADGEVSAQAFTRNEFKATYELMVQYKYGRADNCPTVIKYDSEPREDGDDLLIRHRDMKIGDNGLQNCTDAGAQRVTLAENLTGRRLSDFAERIDGNLDKRTVFDGLQSELEGKKYYVSTSDGARTCGDYKWFEKGETFFYFDESETIRLTVVAKVTGGEPKFLSLPLVGNIRYMISVTSGTSCIYRVQTDVANVILGSARPSDSPSSTPIPSVSSTPSVEASQVPLPSSTPSATPLESVSSSPSASVPPSLSASQTASATPSVSVSQTTSPIPSVSSSLSPSVSASSLPLASSSPSVSASSLPLASSSPSVSSSASPSVPSSVSPPMSPSSSPSVSSSPSTSPTSSATISTTASATISPSVSPTQSSAPSTSVSRTASPIPSTTPSTTPTRSSSPSASTSSRPSATSTPTMTPSRTPTRTPIPSSPAPSPLISLTPEKSLSPTRTPIAVPTVDVSAFPSPSVTPSPSEGSLNLALGSATPSTTPSPLSVPLGSATPSSSPSPSMILPGINPGNLGSDDRNSSSVDGTSTCFPASGVVKSLNGAVRMDELVIGDSVWTGSEWSKVMMFTHQNAYTQATFVKLETANGTITLTGGHYLYVNGQLSAAREVNIGDMISTGAVIGKKTVVERGLYNPQTESGEIVVDGVLTSCYTDAVVPVIGHALLSPIRMVTDFVPGLVGLLGRRIEGFVDGVSVSG